MRVSRIFSPILLALLAMHGAIAQRADAGSGPVRTTAGTVTFIQEANAIDAQLNGTTFDHFSARRIAHFVEPTGARMIVEAFNAGAPELLLYDFTKRPPMVERIGQRMTLTGVFWQRDEVVLKSAEGWYRFQRGTLTKLVSSKTVYH